MQIISWLLKFFGCFGNLHFPYTYNGKMKIDINCCHIATVLIKLLQKCSLSSSLPKCVSFVQTCEFDLLPWQPKNWICQKQYSKINSSEAMSGIKLKLCSYVQTISLYKKGVCFIAVVQVFSLLWQLKVSTELWWENEKVIFIAISMQ